MSAIQQVLAGYAGTAAPTTYWNPADKDTDVVLSGDLKTMWRGGTGSAHALVRAVTGRSTGKRYVEFYSPQARSNVPGGGPSGGLITASYPLAGFGPGDTTGGIAVSFRRYLSSGDSAFFYRNGSALSLGVNVASATGYVGFAVDLDQGFIWINLDGTWLDAKPPNGGGAYYANVPTASVVLYPAATTYYPKATYPDNSVDLRVLATEMDIGATAFNTGQVLDGFLPWGA